MNILNRKNYIIFLLAGFIIAFILVGFETPATAQASIEDAMRDLGCNTAKNCDAFCDLPENNSSGICDAYWEFAGNLSELENIKKRLDYCTTTEECNTYCEIHGDWDCREYYGLQNDTAGLGKLINKMRKAEQAWLAGGGPGGCNSKYSCSLYCATHYEECASFTIDGFKAKYAQPATFHSGIQSVAALKKGLEDNISLPKACQPDYVNGHIGCLSYCTTDNAAPDCVEYLKKTGFLSPTDAALLDLKIQGKTPGAGNPRYNNGCSTLQSCESYCGERSHVNECLAFAEKYGLIVTPKELTIYRKIAPLAVRGLTPTFGSCGIECVCTSVRGCQAVCGLPEKYSECTEFAKLAGLIEEEVPPEKQAVVAAIEKGNAPGGCTNEVACRAYCEDVDHLGECVDFVEKFNLASDDDLKEMRQIADVKKAGIAFPGNCKTKESCLKYCDNSANAVVCMEFAQKAGLIPKEDVEAVGKILPYLKSGGKLPGGCTTKKSCDAYCESDANTIECVNFAAGAGFMTKEEADIVKKVGGKGPGNCRSREACDNYCKDETHIDECVDFAVKAGFISEADAADAKKYKITSGPGNCKSKADCEAFCVLPENQDTCFEFAKKHGMISEEDLKNIEQYRNQGPPDFSQVSPKWLACMEKEMGSAAFERFKAGKSDRSDVSAIQAAQKKCQSEMGPDTTECLAKTTCEEFITCLNPSGNQTSKQGGPEQESPPELKKRMDSCQDELKEIKKKEIDEKMDACLSRSCSEFDVCIKSVQQSNSGEQQSGQQDQGTPNPKLNAKIDACQKEKINACLTKSCGEFQACLNSLGGGGGGSGTPDSAVLAKVKSCQPKQKEGSEKQQQQGGDQSQIPQSFSSWEAFCRANSGDSRCAAYAPQIPQQYPLLPQYPPFAAVLNFLLGARR